jgi:hypothetical protein
MSSKQHGYLNDALTMAKKQAKREKFLSEMEAVVPWQALAGHHAAGSSPAAVVLAQRLTDGRGPDQSDYQAPRYRFRADQ